MASDSNSSRVRVKGKNHLNRPNLGCLASWGNELTSCHRCQIFMARPTEREYNRAYDLIIS